MATEQSKLTIFLSKYAQVAVHRDPITGAFYVTIFTPNNVEEEKSAAWIGSCYLQNGAGDVIWEPFVETPPPPDPTPVNKKYKMLREVNVRSQQTTSSTDIGDVFKDQEVELNLIPANLTASTSGYFWAKIVNITNPTSAQKTMLARTGDKWVAIKNNNDLWVVEVP